MRRRCMYGVLNIALGTLLVLLLSPVCILIAQEETEKSDKKKNPDVEMLECKVRVVDPDGFAVEEATVFCTGIRSKEEPGSHWGWSEEAFGKLPRLKTDKEGLVTMPYPKMLSESKTTGQMTWSVTHPDFVNYRSDHSVDDDPSQIQLERGFRIALTAKDATTNEKITEDIYGIASFAGGSKWELKKNGMLVSSTMKKQNGVLRVVCFAPGKPLLFSDEIEIKPGDKSRVLLKDVELKEGSRLEGKLDASVKRPIRNGYVIASIDKQLNDIDRRAGWHWADEAKIEPDGSYVFESLPRGEAIQLIPICDGWLPAKPKAADVLAAMPDVERPDGIAGMIENFDATPQLARTDDSSVVKDLDMVPCPALTVQVTDESGKPLEGVRVGCSPNQVWFNSGSQILGTSYATRKWLESMKNEDGNNSNSWVRKSRYFLETDSKGIVVFESMPKGGQDIYVFLKGWELTDDIETNERGSASVSVGDENQTVIFKLKPEKDKAVGASEK